jgi:hypothetical protein
VQEEEEEEEVVVVVVDVEGNGVNHSHCRICGTI